MRTPRQQTTDSVQRPIARRFSHTHHRHHYARATSDSGGSNTTTIVAVVCGFVGGVIVLFFLYQLSKKVFRKRANPLPPIQPLSHQRGRTISDFQDTLEGRKTRGATWYDSAYLHPMRTPTGSASSLITGKERDSSMPPMDTASSFYLRDGAGRDTPTMEDAEAPGDGQLPLPHRPFAEHRASSASSNLGSDSRSGSFDELRRESMDPISPTTTPSGSNSPLLTDSGAQPLARPRGRRTSRMDPSRPQSLASNLTSSSNIHGRQGAPHSTHSRMQIVLPAPLAPDLYPYGSESTSDDGSANRRFTMVGDDDDPMRQHRHRTISDAWASPAVSRSSSRGNLLESTPGNLYPVCEKYIKSQSFALRRGAPEIAQLSVATAARASGQQLRVIFRRTLLPPLQLDASAARPSPPQWLQLACLALASRPVSHGCIRCGPHGRRSRSKGRR
jgi:hypothetical protein